MIAPSAPTPIRIHPVFELRREIMILGFRETCLKDTEDGYHEQRITVVSSGGKVDFRTDEWTSYERNGLLYVPDRRYDSPLGVEEQWPGFDEFRKSPRARPGRDLYLDLKGAVHRHVDVEPGAEVILATFPVITFIYPLFFAIAFLLLLGPKGTGKTETLRLLELLVRSGFRAITTTAGIGDLIQSRRATLLLDQTGHLYLDTKNLLVDSYKQGAKRAVVDERNRGMPHEFETFGPKAFAAHRTFDEDLLDRCIQINLLPTSRRLEPLQADDNRLSLLRADLYAYSVLNFHWLAKCEAFLGREGIASTTGLAPRPMELWWPFAVAFEWMGVPEADAEAALAFFKQSLPSTTAELPETERKVLEKLLTLDGKTSDGSVMSDQTALSAHLVGRILKDHSLIISKRRVLSDEGNKVTEWIIDRERLARLTVAWKLEPSET